MSVTHSRWDMIDNGFNVRDISSWMEIWRFLIQRRRPLVTTTIVTMSSSAQTIFMGVPAVIAEWSDYETQAARQIALIAQVSGLGIDRNWLKQKRVSVLPRRETM
jgi:hypothetical protein